MKYDFTKVQRVMAERGLTLEELARKADLHYSTLSKAFARGTASQTTAKALQRALRIPVRDMLVEERKVG